MYAILSAIMTYVAEMAPVLALQLDSQQRIVNANAHACHVLGCQVIGQTLRQITVEFTPLPDLEASEVTVKSSHLLSLKTAGGVPDSYQFRFHPIPEGWMALGNLNIQEQMHLHTQVLELNHELNNLTRQLHQANAELKELNQVKNQFLGMAAHDLRKPVGVIMTYTEFVLDEAGDALRDEHRQFLRTCLNAATGMKQLIDDFLDVAIIESGRLRLNLTTVSVSDILVGVLEIGHLIAARKKVHMLSDSADDKKTIRVDMPKIQQVLINLIGNAVEHSMPGQRVWVSFLWNDRELVFIVRDEGPGIDPKDQVRLFQPFTSASTRKTAGERSVGLGLAIARKVAEAHNGRLWVESIPGRGATFYFALPASMALEARTNNIDN